MQHIDLPAFSNMVKMASQVFIYTVVAVMHTDAEGSPLILLQRHVTLQSLAKTINNLFDSVNSLRLKTSSKCQSAISNESCNVQYFQELIEWFESLKVIKNTRQKHHSSN